MSEDNLGGEAKEDLVQITGFPSKWDATEKCEPKTVKAAQHLSSDLQVLEWLTRDNDPPLQPVLPTQIALGLYGLGDANKGGFGSGISITNEESNGM